jgi:hypothetical protein
VTPGGAAGDLRRAYATARLVAGALWLSLGVYVVVAHAIATSHAPFAGFGAADQRPILRVGAVALAVVVLLAGRRVRARVLAGAPTLHVAPHRQASPVAQRLFTASVATLATWETVAAVGFAAFLLTGRLLDLYAFLAVAAVGLASAAPRYARWEAYAAGRIRA